MKAKMLLEIHNGSMKAEKLLSADVRFRIFVYLLYVMFKHYALPMYEEKEG